MSLADTEPLMTEAELSEYLQVPQRTLRQWRYLSKGPEYVRVGRHIRYRRLAAERWLAGQSTAPGGAATYLETATAGPVLNADEIKATPAARASRRVARAGGTAA